MCIRSASCLPIAFGLVMLLGAGGLALTRSASVEPPPDAARATDTPLAAFEFLVGTWRGEFNGEFVEEIWSAPHGNAMMGMFRWLNADKLSRMYELLTISREGDQTFLRLRHFTRAMHAWEEMDKPVEMRLAEQTDGRAVFTIIGDEGRLERIVFSRPERGRLAIDVEFRAASETPALNFRFRGAD